MNDFPESEIESEYEILLRKCAALEVENSNLKIQNKELLRKTRILQYRLTEYKSYALQLDVMLQTIGAIAMSERKNK